MYIYPNPYDIPLDEWNKKPQVKTWKYERCLNKDFADAEERRTGKRPTVTHISCPCSRCTPSL